MRRWRRVFGSGGERCASEASRRNLGGKAQGAPQAKFEHAIVLSILGIGQRVFDGRGARTHRRRRPSRVSDASIVLHAREARGGERRRNVDVIRVAHLCPPSQKFSVRPTRRHDQGCSGNFDEHFDRGGGAQSTRILSRFRSTRRRHALAHRRRRGVVLDAGGFDGGRVV